MAATGFARLNLAGNVPWPTQTPTFTNHTIDASNEGLSVVLVAFTADAITHVGFRYGARTGTPPTYIIGLETPDAASGNPDGTVLGGGTPASATFTPPADATWDGTWQWVALTNSYTPTVGQVFCPTIRYSSGAIDASNNSSFTRNFSTLTNWAYPPVIANSAGTWTKVGSCPTFAYRTASGRYGWPIVGFYSTRSASTVGHRVACKFTLPANVTSTYTIRGFRFAGSIAAATGKAPIAGLWSASSVIQNVTLDSDRPTSVATGYQPHDFVLFDESSLTTLSPGTAYYIGLEVADATNGGVVISGITSDSSDDATAWPLGTAACLATYDGSTWTDVGTVRPFVELILDDMTQQSGGTSGGYVIGS